MTHATGGWRLFVGLSPAPELVSSIRAWMGNVAQRSDGWRFVRAENMHLTLRFLGATDPGRIDALCESFAPLFRDVRAFELDVRGWGLFPQRGRPRVMWIGLTGDVDPLEKLARRAEQWALENRFAPERRTFSPHLTIARARKGSRPPRIDGEPSTDSPSFGEFPITEAVLFRSHLRSEGPSYEQLAIATLESGSVS